MAPSRACDVPSPLRKFDPEGRWFICRTRSSSRSFTRCAALRQLYRVCDGGNDRSSGTKFCDASMIAVHSFVAASWMYRRAQRATPGNNGQITATDRNARVSRFFSNGQRFPIRDINSLSFNVRDENKIRKSNSRSIIVATLMALVGDRRAQWAYITMTSLQLLVGEPCGCSSRNLQTAETRPNDR
jgi:hypothetical protein